MALISRMLKPFHLRRGNYSKIPDSEDWSPGNQQCAQESSEFLLSSKHNDSSRVIEKKIRVLQALNFILLLVIFTLLVLFGVYALASNRPAKYEQLEWSGLLGEDPGGFVPNGVGQPLRPTYFGPDHPYYLPEDTYDDFNKSIAYVRKIKALHNSSSVLANRHYGKRIRPDGHVSGLAPFFTWSDPGKGRQIYTLRGFHHMHCLITIAEEFAYHFHNQSKWAGPHIAHCVNTLRDAIQCLADAQPLSFVNGFGVGQVTDDQAAMCRDWSALRAWGNDPSRGLRMIDSAAPGSKWENITEILPYPTLTDLELKGLA